MDKRLVIAQKKKPPSVSGPRKTPSSAPCGERRIRPAGSQNRPASAPARPQAEKRDHPGRRQMRGYPLYVASSLPLPAQESGAQEKSSARRRAEAIQPARPSVLARAPVSRTVDYQRVPGGKDLLVTTWTHALLAPLNSFARACQRAAPAASSSTPATATLVQRLRHMQVPVL